MGGIYIRNEWRRCLENLYRDIRYYGLSVCDALSDQFFEMLCHESELGYVRERAMIETVPEPTSKIRSVLPV